MRPWALAGILASLLGANPLWAADDATVASGELPALAAEAMNGTGVSGTEQRVSDATAEDSARGILRAQDQAVLASEINGRVLEMPFRDGESFHRGDLLVRFDCSAYQAQLAAALAASSACCCSALERSSVTTMSPRCTVSSSRPIASAQLWPAGLQLQAGSKLWRYLKALGSLA